jgi:putative transposase
MDNLQSRWSREKTKKKRRMKKAWHKMITKIKNIVLDVHRKTAKSLCDLYDVIVLPRFGTHKMTKRTERKISSKTHRAMLTWAFFRFEQMLKAKASVTGKIVQMTTEEYTSKTCTS